MVEGTEARLVGLLESRVKFAKLLTYWTSVVPHARDALKEFLRLRGVTKFERSSLKFFIMDCVMAVQRSPPICPASFQ